jgi:hypothetical protein
LGLLDWCRQQAMFPAVTYTSTFATLIEGIEKESIPFCFAGFEPPQDRASQKIAIARIVCLTPTRIKDLHVIV